MSECVRLAYVASATTHSVGTVIAPCIACDAAGGKYYRRSDRKLQWVPCLECHGEGGVISAALCPCAKCKAKRTADAWRLVTEKGPTR